MIKDIIIKNELIARIYKKNFHIEKGISFKTNESSALQFGCMKRDKGYNVKPHIHKKIMRQIDTTQEILIVRKGEIECTFFLNGLDESKIETIVEGDILHIYKGGHSFDFKINSEVIEIKQGPFLNIDEKYFL